MNEARRVAVLGAGSWGTALAMQLARNGHRTRLWGRNSERLRAMAREGRNRYFLNAHPFPPGLEPVTELCTALDGAEVALLAVPSEGFRDALERLVPGFTGGLVWATKGFDPASGEMLHAVAGAARPGRRDHAVLSGPSFAAEVAAGLPTAVTLAALDAGFATFAAALFHGGRFRVYTSDDVVGVQIGGGVKNVLAIAAGISDGLGFGANARAALITRGLAEIVRLGVRLGGRRETLTGLAGLGDLVLTCTDDQSRNRRFGLALAGGAGVEAAVRRIGQVVEGVGNARLAGNMAAAHGVEMPIVEQVGRIVAGRVRPETAVAELLARAPREEG